MPMNLGVDRIQNLGYFSLDKMSTVNKIDINTKNVLERIRQELDRQGLKDKELAALLGRSAPGFSLIMAGQRRITVDVLYAIAEKLNVDVHSLLPSKNQSQGAVSIEEYFRELIREEIEKVLGKKDG